VTTRPSRFNPTSPARPAPGPDATAAAAERAERLVDAVLGAVAFRDVAVPRTQVKGRMRLLTRAETAQVNVDLRREMADRYHLTEPTPGMFEAFAEYREERVLRTIAVAMRDPADPSRPLADLDEWATCDDQQLVALWEAYKDLQDELDPLGPSAPGLTGEEVAALKAAAGKGEADLLMSYGSRRLALFVITSAAPPPS
jgi:hypothetical protein